MQGSTVRFASVTLVATLLSAACDSETSDSSPGPAVGGQAGGAGLPAASGGSSGGAVAGGMSTGGSGGAGGVSGSQGGAGDGGLSEGGADGFGGAVPEECGDPARDGVVVYQDIVTETTWSCPVYTLTQPVYVHSQTQERTVLHIRPGVTVRGVKGIEPTKLPGALIITRTARLDAVGSKAEPILFTAVPTETELLPGSWGGVMLLGRATTNVPENFETSGKPAGETYAEALPKSELGLYGWPLDSEAAAGGAGNMGGAGGAGGADGGSDVNHDDWDCGSLQFARIEFAGFKVGSTKELNGLTLGGCGTQTLVDHVQIHRSSDDGVEIFGGTVNLSHLVLTGNQDDALDWDQGWRGKAQFVAIQAHDDADSADSCGIEADGYATPDAPVGAASSPRLWNLTLIASKNTQRGIRFRDGTEAFIGNAILASHALGVPKGLIDVDHVLTADALATGKLRVQHSILRGTWPTIGQANTLGTVYNEQDHFTGNGAGALGNTVIGAASELWLNAFNTASPDWVPASGSAAADGALNPSDVDDAAFFDTAAKYRGAFQPGGQDWTAGWTAYP